VSGAVLIPHCRSYIRYPRTSFVVNCSVGSLSRANPAQEGCAGRECPHVEPRLQWRKEQEFSTGNNS
jgi:hypothetical protein